MKKLIVLLIVLLCFTGCSSATSEKTTTTTDTTTTENSADLNEEIVSYFTNYEMVSSSSDGELFGARFDDGTEEGFALIVKYSDAQKAELEALDIFDENYDEKYKTIVEESTDFGTINLNELDTQSELEQYVGKTIGDMMDDGYEDYGYMIDDSECCFNLQSENYAVQVKTVELIKEDDLSTNLEKSLTIESIILTDYTLEYYASLVD